MYFIVHAAFVRIKLMMMMMIVLVMWSAACAAATGKVHFVTTWNIVRLRYNALLSAFQHFWLHNFFCSAHQLDCTSVKLRRACTACWKHTHTITPSLFHSRLKTYLFHKSYPPPPVVSLLPPGLPPRTFAWTVSSELLGFFLFFFYFFVSGPCARLSWPSRQLLSAR